MSALSGGLLFDFHRSKEPLGVTAMPCEIAADLIGGFFRDLGMDCHYCCVLPICFTGLRFLCLLTDRANDDILLRFGQILLA